MSIAYEVAWSGTMARERAERLQQSYVTHRPQESGVATVDMVRDYLASRAGRSASTSEIATALASTTSSVTHACGYLALRGEADRTGPATYRTTVGGSET
jgi:hypothetical protein